MANPTAQRSTRSTIKFDVRKPTYSPTPDLYLLAVLSDPARAALGTSWLARADAGRLDQMQLEQADLVDGGRVGRALQVGREPLAAAQVTDLRAVDSVRDCMR